MNIKNCLKPPPSCGFNMLGFSWAVTPNFSASKDGFTKPWGGYLWKSDLLKWWQVEW